MRRESATPAGVGPLRRRLSAATVRLAGTAVLARLLGALGQYPPRPRIVVGTTRVVESYGPDPEQVGEWWVPPGAAQDGGPPLPTVVLVHGGFWRAGYDRSLEDALAADLSGRGLLCWVPDYRPSDLPWPTTMTDVAAAADHLAHGRFADRVDRARLAFVGHSAGGHLVLWLAARAGIAVAADAPDGFRPTSETVRPTLVVSQAGVGDLTTAGAAGLGRGAAVDLVGGRPDTLDGRYAVADPIRLLPTGLATVLIHGTADPTVPLGQSTAYLAAARAAGDPCELVEVPGGHREHLDPGSAAGQALRRVLTERFAGS